jgi:alanine-synthesizing transaminase
VFSDRLPWGRPLNALGALEQQRRDAGATLIDLTESNPTQVGLPYPEQALRAALALPHARYLPAPRGLPVAREAVAGAYRRDGHAISADRIVITASSSESYGFLFKLLCDPGDSVLVPEPSYPLFEYLARLEGVRPAGYRLVYDGQWRIDFSSLESALARAGDAGRARAVVVVNPNNPTGSFVDGEDQARLAALCRRAGLAIISDEVFAPFRFRDLGSGASCLAAAPDVAGQTLTFSLGGLSKSCGLPQLKLGWIAVGGPGAIAEAALANLDLIADTYLSVGTAVQLALPRLFEIGSDIRRAIRRRVRGNRARLRGAVPATSPCTVLESAGGWTAILRVPAADGADAGADSDEYWASRLLRDDDVLVHPGYLFDMPAGAYLVVSLLPEPATFATGIARVIARCADSVP